VSCVERVGGTSDADVMAQLEMGGGLDRRLDDVVATAGYSIGA
jgi:hypothetical protein